jgi:glycosyltransferase involved in cell wall biosynthesis
MTNLNESKPRISAIVPARNEEAVIAACVESLAQQEEILEILVVDDQSTDRTAEIVSELSRRDPRVRLLRASELPAGWVGKNHAVWLGSRESRADWLLFTDADAVHAADSAARAMDIATQHNTALVSFSPEQVMATWHEKSLIPYIYCRLSEKFSFDAVNDSRSDSAAANGQFILISRNAYEAVGGHASVAGEVLEDVALVRRIKRAGYPIWFGSGKGIVRVRMYRSFAAMREGWKKNLYQLMGESPSMLVREILLAISPVYLTLLAGDAIAGFTRSRSLATATIVAGLLLISAFYEADLRRNQFPSRLAIYGILGRLLFFAVLWDSYKSHLRGRLEWKGRKYPVGTPDASKG